MRKQLRTYRRLVSEAGLNFSSMGLSRATLQTWVAPLVLRTGIRLQKGTTGPEKHLISIETPMVAFPRPPPPIARQLAKDIPSCPNRACSPLERLSSQTDVVRKNVPLTTLPGSKYLKCRPTVTQVVLQSTETVNVVFPSPPPPIARLVRKEIRPRCQHRTCPSKHSENTISKANFSGGHTPNALCRAPSRKGSSLSARLAPGAGDSLSPGMKQSVRTLISFFETEKENRGSFARQAKQKSLYVSIP